MHRMRSGIGLALALILAAGNACAQWPPGPDSSLQVANSGIYNANLSMIPDGLGGAFLSWSAAADWCIDYFNYNQVWIQKVAASGRSSWNPAGILRSRAGTQPAITTDGRGGFIAVWKDQPSHHDYSISFSGLVAQRFDADGTPHWAADKVISGPGESTYECDSP